MNKEEYYAISDKINYNMIDTLKKWIINEKSNLDSFMANPEGHILYSPFINPNWVALQLRSDQLGQVITLLTLISSYKQGTGATRTQHDYALDNIPIILWQRLLDWILGKYVGMVKLADSQKISTPVDEYQELLEFNIELFSATVSVYADSIEGLKGIIQYKQEQI